MKGPWPYWCEKSCRGLAVKVMAFWQGLKILLYFMVVFWKHKWQGQWIFVLITSGSISIVSLEQIGNMFGVFLQVKMFHLPVGYFCGMICCNPVSLTYCVILGRDDSQSWKDQRHTLSDLPRVCLRSSLSFKSVFRRLVSSDFCFKTRRGTICTYARPLVW